MTMQMYEATAEVTGKLTTQSGPHQVGTALADFTAHGDVLLDGKASWFTPSTRIVVSITELDPVSKDPKVGDTRMTVHNVSPYQGGVKVRVTIESSHDLPVRLILVLD